MARFGKTDLLEIDEEIENTKPKNTKKTHASIWNQFQNFCKEKCYTLDESTSTEALALILKDYAFNMKKTDGTDYKEGVIKTMWNITAKNVQQLYFESHNIVFNPFTDMVFKQARDARDTKRKILQNDPTKRKQSSTAFSPDEYQSIIHSFDEETPSGLQQKFYQIVAVELAWRGGEAVSCMIDHFKEEQNNKGESTGRIEYNPLFTKTTQGGSKKMADSKWLLLNTIDENVCPVRLFRKLVSKRGPNITSRRLFLTNNRYWTSNNNKAWYKNSPMGRNELSSWTKKAALSIGLDIKRIKVTNHSNRSTAVSSLAQHGVEEQQLIKITGHGNASSIRPYLQLNHEHHASIINKMRDVHDLSVPTTDSTTTSSLTKPTSSSASTSSTITSDQKKDSVVYQNCSFYINCTNFKNN